MTIATFILAGSMLKMADHDPQLWDVELFKTLLTLVVGTAIVNMILAFHFTANKSDETKADNTGKAFDAIAATAKAGDADAKPDVTLRPGETAQAQPLPDPTFGGPRPGGPE